MITVDIEMSEDQPTTEFDKIIEEFPFHYVDYEVDHRHDGSCDHILIQLAQDDLTPEQETYLNRCEYVNEYNTREGSITDAPLDTTSLSVVRDTLKPVQPAYTNAYKSVFYMESEFNQTIVVVTHTTEHTCLEMQQIRVGNIVHAALSAEETDTLLSVLLQQKVARMKRIQAAMVEVEEEA
jgi:hypothetical protein